MLLLFVFILYLPRWERIEWEINDPRISTPVTLGVRANSLCSSSSSLFLAPEWVKEVVDRNTFFFAGLQFLMTKKRGWTCCSRSISMSNGCCRTGSRRHRSPKTWGESGCSWIWFKFHCSCIHLQSYRWSGCIDLGRHVCGVLGNWHRCTVHRVPRVVCASCDQESLAQLLLLLLLRGVRKACSHLLVPYILLVRREVLSFMSLFVQRLIKVCIGCGSSLRRRRGSRYRLNRWCCRCCGSSFRCRIQRS